MPFFEAQEIELFWLPVSTGSPRTVFSGAQMPPVAVKNPAEFPKANREGPLRNRRVAAGDSVHAPGEPGSSPRPALTRSTLHGLPNGRGAVEALLAPRPQLDSIKPPAARLISSFDLCP